MVIEIDTSRAITCKKIKRDDIKFLVSPNKCYIEWKKELFDLGELKFLFNKLEDISEEFVKGFEKEGLGYEKNVLLERVETLLESARKSDFILTLQLKAILMEMEKWK